MRNVNLPEGKELSPTESFIALTFVLTGMSVHIASHFGMIEFACACARSGV